MATLTPGTGVHLGESWMMYIGAHRKFYLVAVAVFLAIAVGSPPVLADDAADTSDTTLANDEWSFALAPYLWTSGLSGTVGASGAPPVTIDVSPLDVLESLDMGFMGVAVVHHGR